MVTRQSPGDRLGFGDRQRVDVCELFDTHSASRTDLFAAYRKVETASRSQTVGRRREVDYGHLFGTGVVDQPLVADDSPVVDDHDEVEASRHRWRGSAEPTTVEQLGCQ